MTTTPDDHWSPEVKAAWDGIWEDARVKPANPADEFREAVAANIRAERSRIGIGQDLLAERMRKLGYSAWIRQTVSNVERGERRVTADELPGLVRCLGCHITNLIPREWWR